MSNTAQKVPRQMHCIRCRQIRPRKGAKLIAGTGYVCAPCVPDLQPSAPKRGQRSPEGRQPAESKEAWRPYAVDPKLSEPAQPARDAAIPPGVKVTVRPAPPGRFDVPLDFRGGFMAEWELLREGSQA